MSSIDLRTCKPGDKLKSKHGLILTYVRPTTPEDGSRAYYDHIVKYPDQPPFGPKSEGTRTHDGFTFRNPASRLESDHDIVEIIPS